MSIKVIEFTLGRFQTHNYLVYDDKTKRCVLIDTGEDPKPILQALKEHQLNLELILYTHAHIDHMAGCGLIQSQYPLVPLWVHKKEMFWIDLLATQASKYGIPEPTKPMITGYIQDKQVFDMGTFKLESRFCPGHTPGGISFYCPEAKLVFTGDSLFAGTIGRTDFPKGDHATLIKSIQTQLMTLPEETLVYSGHGPQTSIGIEKAHNPYL